MKRKPRLVHFSAADLIFVGFVLVVIGAYLAHFFIHGKLP